MPRKKDRATLEIKLASAAIVKDFKDEIGSTTTDQNMAFPVHFLLIPKGG